MQLFSCTRMKSSCCWATTKPNSITEPIRRRSNPTALLLADWWSDARGRMHYNSQQEQDTHFTTYLLAGNGTGLSPAGSAAWSVSLFCPTDSHFTDWGTGFKLVLSCRTNRALVRFKLDLLGLATDRLLRSGWSFPSTTPRGRYRKWHSWLFQALD